MRAIGVIPARLGSTRFKEKVLAPICGKPMIRYVWEEVSKSKLLNEVIIACDDKKIIAAAKSFGAKAVMTSKTHQSGTDRIAQAVRDLNFDLIVNIQGDEPLIKAVVIDDLLKMMQKDKDADIGTVIKKIQNKSDLNNPNVVKVVTDDKGFAMYFSRALIPYDRENKGAVYFKHLGIYAYSKDALMRFTSIAKSRLEQIEKLEQLRALEAGLRIKTILTYIETIGVDTAADLKKVERLLKK
ncbi:MAG: 3-deoxy-manno-octulosonate cytidylyltransferase [Candidatus Omnitrophica bacterium]|nr:3-deoxy-manno-octulosonate cytidylyltransferase [Candidatus Omnitrophota bacterium]